MRRLTGCVAVAALALAAEPALGIHGHWPTGFVSLLGVSGALLLAVGSKALGRAGLQEPDTADAPEDEA
jgi:hypothetical protein